MAMQLTHDNKKTIISTSVKRENKTDSLLYFRPFIEGNKTLKTKVSREHERGLPHTSSRLEEKVRLVSSKLSLTTIKKNISYELVSYQLLRRFKTVFIENVYIQ